MQTVPTHTKTDRLRATIRNGWPSITVNSDTIRSKTSPATATECQGSSFSFTMNNIYPRQIFEQTSSWITDIHSRTNDEHKAAVVEKELTESLCRAVFGSNAIERAGLGLDITLKLCRRIFEGEDVGDIDERTPEYKRRLDELMDGLGNKETDYKTIIRGRREIVQHALAMQYLIEALITQNKSFSEDLIKTTHAILCYQVPITAADGEVPSSAYSGKYRTVHVGAGNTMFVPPTKIGETMNRFVHDLNNELDEAMKKGEFDPFDFAAKYSMEFVLIHPFQDGNGRTCRMILNAILCKYAGIVVPIGEDEADREDYLSIKKRASNEMTGHGEYATFILMKAKTRVREMKKKLAGKPKHDVHVNIPW